MARTHIARVGTSHRDGAVLLGDVFNNYNGFVYLPLPTPTTCTLADTWYLVQGAFSPVAVEGFTPVFAPTAGLRYDGDCEQYFEAVWAATCKLAAGSDTISIGVGIDGADPHVSTVQSNVLITSPNQMTGPAVLALQPGEVSSFFVKSALAGTVVTFDYFSGYLRPFTKSPAC